MPEPALARQSVLATLVVLAAAATSCRTPRAAPAGVEHVVVVWLRQPGDAAARQRIIEASKAFEAIPGVLAVRVGTALPSDRPVVDDSFDVALVVSLRDRDALATYLEHPLHKAAVEEVLRPLVARFVVYDASLATVPVGEVATQAPEQTWPQPIEQRGLWGYADADGRVVIPARFHVAEPFSAQGLAAVADDSGWAYVDRGGAEVIRPHVVDNGPDPFSEGMARFGTRGRFGVFDERGEVGLEPRFDFARPVSEGMAAVCMGCRVEPQGEHTAVVGGQWGYVDVAADIVHPLMWDRVDDFSGGLARVSRAGVWACFDRQRRDAPCPPQQQEIESGASPVDAARQDSLP